jgi:hypothetical protein
MISLIAAKPVCLKCKHYIKDAIPELSKCAKIKYEYLHEFAIISRDRKELCGPQGKYYEPKD